ncbi:unnamed protein product, partial [Lymnaea stagnalis]
QNLTSRDGIKREENELLENVISAQKFKGPITANNIGERLAIIIREYEDFENALVNTTDSIQGALGNVPIFILADHLPYPPLKLNPKGTVKVITLSSNLNKNYSSACPLHFINTQYVLILPDAVKLRNLKQIIYYMHFLKAKKKTDAIAIPIGDTRLQCSGLYVDLKRWTLSLNANLSDASLFCPLVIGAQALLMETKVFKSLPEPFARPFPFTFYVQARAANLSVRVAKGEKLAPVAKLYMDPHNNWKHKRAEAERLDAFYRSVGIKQEILHNNITRFYGCDKDKPRCFGTIVNDMPDYLYEGRWTPPCCLKALRETAKHVFTTLENCHVRYWLEGGSLLGAVRQKDIIPWDYDVDIGIYREDLSKCGALVDTKNGAYTDDLGFVWEKAVEGKFYRVQYSAVNHLHVDIYPFYSKHGVMTKDTWLLTHRQDVEFPERFLLPLTKIEFAGVMTYAPNNVKEFLEYKFGEGVIENPKYPNLQNPV